MDTPNDPTLDQLGLSDAPSEARKRKAPRATAARPFVYAPEKMLARPEEHAQGAEAGFWYWLGVTASAPFAYANLNGPSFSKVTELVDQEGSETRRIPRIGDIVFLTVDLAERMLRRLPLVVVRRYPNQDVEANAAGAVRNTGNPYRTSSRGHLITITGEAEAAALRAKSIPVPRYDYDPNDEPVSRYLFAEICADQDNPQVGFAYPPSLEDRAFEYPLQLNVGEPR